MSICVVIITVKKAASFPVTFICAHKPNQCILTCGVCFFTHAEMYKDLLKSYIFQTLSAVICLISILSSFKKQSKRRCQNCSLGVLLGNSTTATLDANSNLFCLTRWRTSAEHPLYLQSKLTPLFLHTDENTTSSE